MTASETASFAEFAELLRVKRSYITALKKSDRLVLTDDGKSVRVAESIARIRATADPSKAGVVARHAAERGDSVGQVGGDSVTTADTEPPPPENDDDESDVLTGGRGRVGASYQAARAVKERYLAAAAKRDYEVSMRKLLEADAVADLVSGATITLRATLETLPTTLAPQLAAMRDETEIRMLLAESIAHAMEELSRQFHQASEQGGANG